MSRRRSRCKTKFYHANPRGWRRGDILTGGHPGGAGYAHWNVCMTDSPAPYATVADRAHAEDWYVYEVRPLGRTSYVEGNGEFQTQAAVVIGRVGRAQALSARFMPGARRARWYETEGGGRRYVSYVERATPRRGVRTYPFQTRRGIRTVRDAEADRLARGRA